MPKAFNEREKALIRADLLEKGRQIFEIYGLKKTSIDDLARAAGISKGAFYLFFPSKEELFMQILESIEDEFRSGLFQYGLASGQSARQNFKSLLHSALLDLERYPLLRQVDQETFQHLARKLPPERVQLHASNDDAYVQAFAERWRSDGHELRLEPHSIASLMKALFFVSLHKDDFGAEAYAETMHLLIESVTEYLIPA